MLRGEVFLSSAVPRQWHCRTATQGLYNKIIWRQGVWLLPGENSPLYSESPTAPHSDITSILWGILIVSDSTGRCTDNTESVLHVHLLSVGVQSHNTHCRTAGAHQGEIMRFISQREGPVTLKSCSCGWSGKMKHSPWKALKSVGKVRKNTPAWKFSWGGLILGQNAVLFFFWLHHFRQLLSLPQCCGPALDVLWWFFL